MHSKLLEKMTIRTILTRCSNGLKTAMNCKCDSWQKWRFSP